MPPEEESIKEDKSVEATESSERAMAELKKRRGKKNKNAEYGWEHELKNEDEGNDEVSDYGLSHRGVAFGAFQKDTQQYVHPESADREKEFECMKCKRKVILRRGQINRAHFAHYKNKPACNFYTRPSESDHHKDAKYKLASMLREGRSILIHWPCSNLECGRIGIDDFETAVPKRAGYPNRNLTVFDSVPVPRLCTGTTVKCEQNLGDYVMVEYHDPHGKYVADVALLNGNTIKYIFEIRHSHATTTDCRPEPWFEISTDDFSNLYGWRLDNSSQFFSIFNKKQIIFDCCRKDITVKGIIRHCHSCLQHKEYPRVEAEFKKDPQWPRFRIAETLPGIRGGKISKQFDNLCQMCGTSDYCPVFLDFSLQICKSCLVWYEKDLKSQRSSQGNDPGDY